MRWARRVARMEEEESFIQGFVGETWGIGTTWKT
jgi:hypothetical protein